MSMTSPASPQEGVAPQHEMAGAVCGRASRMVLRLHCACGISVAA